MVIIQSRGSGSNLNILDRVRTARDMKAKKFLYNGVIYDSIKDLEKASDVSVKTLHRHKKIQYVYVPFYKDCTYVEHPSNLDIKEVYEEYFRKYFKL